jgi:hypothetical protein
MMMMMMMIIIIIIITVIPYIHYAFHTSKFSQTDNMV